MVILLKFGFYIPKCMNFLEIRIRSVLFRLTEKNKKSNENYHSKIHYKTAEIGGMCWKLFPR